MKHFSVLKNYSEQLRQENGTTLRILNPGLSLREEQEASRKSVRIFLITAAAAVLLLLVTIPLSFVSTALSEELAVLAVVILAFSCYLRFRSAEEIQKRRESIEEDYSEIVMSLAGLMIAGYSVRNAWHKLAQDYSEQMDRLSEKERIHKRRYAYEELVLTDRKIRQGAPEIEAYREYARIMGSRQYLRLSELLEQFIRTGRKDVYDLWNREHTQALQEKKNRMSEKAARRETALALPMVILLGMIMAMILVPAMMSF